MKIKRGAFLLLFLFLVSFANSPLYSQGLKKEKNPASDSNKSEVLFFYQKGAEYLNNGDAGKAVKFLNLAVQKDPKYSMSYLILGDIYASDPLLKDYDAAVKNYQDFIKYADQNTLKYKSDVYKKIADTCFAILDMRQFNSQEQQQYRDLAETSCLEALKGVFYDNAELKKTLIFISLARISIDEDNIKDAKEWIGKVNPQTAEYIPEYLYYSGYISHLEGNNELAKQQFAAIKDIESPYYKKAAKLVDEIHQKEQREIFIFLVALGCTILALTIYLILYRRRIRREKAEGFSILHFDEKEQGVWTYKGKLFDDVGKAALFMEEVLCSITKMPFSFVLFYDKCTGLLVPPAGANEKIAELSLSCSDEHVDIWFDRRGSAPFLLRREQNEMSFLRAFPDNISELEKLNAEIGIPVFSKSSFIAVAYICDEKLKKHSGKLKKIFNENVDVLKMFAERMSCVFDGISHQEQLHTDKDTGLYNRDFYDTKLSLLRADYLRGRKEHPERIRDFSVIVALIDDFDKWKDSIGIEYAIQMRNMAAKKFGKEKTFAAFPFLLSQNKFALITIGMSFEDAFKAAVKLQASIRDTKLTYQSDSVSVSCAVGCCMGFDGGVNRMKLCLEKALEASSLNGGNQVISAEDEKIKALVSPNLPEEPIEEEFVEVSHSTENSEEQKSENKKQKTKPVKQEPKPVTQEAKPVKQEAKPVTQEAKPVTQEAKPVKQEAKPVTQEVKPVKQEVKPVTQEVKPVKQEVKPVKQEVKPAAQEVKPVKQEVKPVKQEVKPVKQDVKPVAQEVKPVVPQNAQGPKTAKLNAQDVKPAAQKSRPAELPERPVKASSADLEDDLLSMPDFVDIPTLKNKTVEPIVAIKPSEEINPENEFFALGELTKKLK